MRIGELSRRTGVSPRSLRYYEEQGLLASTRTAGGHREYGPPALERVDRIQCLFAAGLSSNTIYELLPCIYAQERGDPAPDLLDNLRVERERIKESLGRLDTGGADLTAEIRANDFVELPVTASEAQRAARLPLHHRDPFDRVLIAQAQVHQLALMTADRALEAYDVQVVGA
jgi:DNA-binding transcriptional MerR regulator